MNGKLTQNKRGEKFSSGLIAILLSITISTIAFISEDNKITGFVISADSSDVSALNHLIKFKDIKSLATLAAGSYYIDDDGIVYWLDDESKPAIAKVNFVDESQKNRQIYIDNNGRIGYILNTISINGNQVIK